MKKIILIVALSLSFLMVFNGYATTIDFDNSPVGTLAAGTQLLNQYSSLGVTFSAYWNESDYNAEQMTNTYVYQEYPLPSGGNYWTNTVVVPTTQGYQTDDLRFLRADFSQGTFSLSFDYMSSWGDRDIIFSYYDSSDSLLYAQSINTGGDPWDNSLAVSYTSNSNAISYVLLDRGPLGRPPYEWFFAVDNMTFDAPGNNTDPVPEPSTVLLFSFGLLGLAGVSRNKK